MAESAHDIERQILGEVWTSGEIYNSLLYLCDDLGSRFGGTESEHKAAEFLLQKMKEYGLQNVHLEEFPVYAWERGNCELSLTAPVERDFSAIAMPFAGSGEFEGEVIDLGEGEAADFDHAGDAVPAERSRRTSRRRVDQTRPPRGTAAYRRPGRPSGPWR